MFNRPCGSKLWADFFDEEEVSQQSQIMAWGSGVASRGGKPACEIGPRARADARSEDDDVRTDGGLTTSSLKSAGSPRSYPVFKAFSAEDFQYGRSDVWSELSGAGSRSECSSRQGCFAGGFVGAVSEASDDASGAESSEAQENVSTKSAEMTYEACLSQADSSQGAADWKGEETTTLVSPADRFQGGVDWEDPVEEYNATNLQLEVPKVSLLVPTQSADTWACDSEIVCHRVVSYLQGPQPEVPQSMSNPVQSADTPTRAWQPHNPDARNRTLSFMPIAQQEAPQSPIEPAQNADTSAWALQPHSPDAWNQGQSLMPSVEQEFPQPGTSSPAPKASNPQASDEVFQQQRPRQRQQQQRGRQQQQQEVATTGKKPAPTLGSAQHGTGRCRPCLFVKTPIGCDKGESCKFCHFKHGAYDPRRPCKSKRDRYKSLLARTLARGDGNGSEAACQ